MAWTPISGTMTQYQTSTGALASSYHLKFYQSGTTTAFNMATDSTGGTTLDKCELDSSGYPTTDGSTRFIPHVNQKYKIALYKNSTDADNNTIGSADWVIDAIEQPNTISNSEIIFETVAAMVASATLSIGDHVRTLGYTSIGDGGGNEYDIVAAATGTDDGGAYIDLAAHQAKGLFPGALHSVRQWGAGGAGTTNDTTATQSWINYCLRNGKSAYAPQGTYLLYPKTTGQIRLDQVTAANQNLLMYGDGIGNTIFKEADGETALGGRFTRTFWASTASTEAETYGLGSYIFKDFTIDKNGGSNGAAPTSYEWEGAHALSFAGDAVGSYEIPLIKFENVEVQDKVGVGLAIVGATTGTVSVKTLIFDNVVTSNFAGLDAGNYGQKGCIEAPIDSEMTTIANCNLRYSQIEPSAAYSSSRIARIKCTNSKIDVWDYTFLPGADGGETHIRCDISNLTCTDKYLSRGTRTRISNSTIKVPDAIYDIDFRATNCNFLLDYDSGTFVVSSLYILSTATWATGPVARFSNCDFKIDSTSVSASTTGYLVRSNARDTYTESAKVTFDSCTFDPRGFGTVAVYSQGGHFTFNECEMAGIDTCTFAGSLATGKYGGIIMNNCDFSQVTGDTMAVRAYNTNALIEIRGSYDADDLDFVYTVNTSIDDIYKVKPHIVGTAAPVSGSWSNGDRLFNRLPTADGNNMVLDHWVCTSRGTPGTWVAQYISTVSPAT